MKNLYIIGGTMGVGKTAVCQRLKTRLDKAVFLDGDWCWDAHPFVVNEQTKTMVLQNITFLLRQFIACDAYQNVVFCWVMHQQGIIDCILNGLDLHGVNVKCISLICTADELKKRLTKDVECGIRQPDVIERSIARLPLYDGLDTVKVATDGKSIDEVCDCIALL